MRHGVGSGKDYQFQQPVSVERQTEGSAEPKAMEGSHCATLISPTQFMSHFALLVIGPDPEGQLAPFHEFECTGLDNQYVQDIDITEECRKEFSESKSTRYKDPSGDLHDPYQDRFYREPTKEEAAKELGGTGCGDGISWTSKDWGDGKGYRAKVHYVPEGWSEVEIPTSKTESLSEWIESYHGKNIVKHDEAPDFNKKHKYGYAKLDAAGNVVKVIDRTNPNKRWDWYRIGGRYAGRLLLKKGVCAPAAKPGYEVDFGQKAPSVGTTDSALKGDIDFEKLREDAAHDAKIEWDFVADIFGDLPEHLSWKTSMDLHDDIEVARKVYHVQPRILAWEARKKMERERGTDRNLPVDLTFGNADDFIGTRESYIERAKLRSFSAFAVLKDGEWYERGEMGWFASVSNEKDEDQWYAEFSKLVSDLPNDTLLTIIDCHI